MCACRPWACGMKRLFAYWWFNSVIIRMLFKVFEPIWRQSALQRRHGVLFCFPQARGSTLALFTCICTCPIYNQACDSCGRAARSMRHLLIDRYGSTNGQSPSLCLSLNHAVSFIEWRGAAGQRRERDARLSVPVVLREMDGLCCALAVERRAETK